MKRLILVATCAALFAGCSVGTKYDYEVMEARPVDTNFKAAMGTISSTDRFGNPMKGGTVVVTPINQPPLIDQSSPYRSITGRDENGDGRWEEVVVCGYAPRDDGRPAGCITLLPPGMGSNWNFDTAPEDEGHVRIAYDQRLVWVGRVTRARAVLLHTRA